MEFEGKNSIIMNIIQVEMPRKEAFLHEFVSFWSEHHIN